MRDDEWEVVRSITAETDRRPMRSASVEIIDVGDDCGLAPPGSIIVYVAEAGSDMLARVRDAAADPSLEPVLLDDFRSMSDGAEPLPLSDAAQEVVDARIHGELRIGGRLLLSHVVVPNNVPIVAHALAYNGGSLPDGGLVLVERHLADSPELEAVALRRQPKLSPAARLAIDSLDDSQAELNVMADADCGDNGTVVGFVITATVLATITVVRVVTLVTTVAAARDEELMTLSDEQIEELGPHATSRAILEAHRSALRSSAGS